MQCKHGYGWIVHIEVEWYNPYTHMTFGHKNCGLHFGLNLAQLHLHRDGRNW